ncbi:hypothetical protein K439DRAFT_1139068 [Ramaria rubella]|nr:hypothetical protein K439DRAFT_1139068 [Ramaria rubella]
MSSVLEIIDLVSYRNFHMTTNGWSDDDEDINTLQSTATCLLRRPVQESYTKSWDYSFDYLRRLSASSGKSNTYGLLDKDELLLGHSLYSKLCVNDQPDIVRTCTNIHTCPSIGKALCPTSPSHSF